MRRGVRAVDAVSVDAAWNEGAPVLVIARLHSERGWLLSGSYLVPPDEERGTVGGAEALRRDPSLKRAVRLKPGEFALRRRSIDGPWYFADFEADEDLSHRVTAEARQIV
jgi:hypothetical protein